jgi:filamentous hemagglutinin family protein
VKRRPALPEPPLSRPAPPSAALPGEPATRAFNGVLLAALALCSPSLHAGARTDGTAGAVQTLSGRFVVPQTLGRSSGANLFHSFQRFGIDPGESATFTTTSTALQNVIVRVTGGETSVLQGALRLDAAAGSRPNFYLVNPAGVTLGAGGSVDVPGALHLSTASYLKLADGSVYETDLAKGSSFSAAVPSSFGFVGGRRGALVLALGATVTVADGHSASLTGGDVSIGTNVLVSGGSLRIAAVGGGAAELGLAGPMPALEGRLVVDHGALVGSVQLRPTDVADVVAAAGDIVVGAPGDVSASSIASVTSAAGGGGTVRIEAANSLTLQHAGLVSSFTDQAGRGADLSISTGGALSIGPDSGILAGATAAGSAGEVTVTAAGGVVVDGGGTQLGAGIGSESYASGRSGTVTVSTPATLALLNGGRISNSVYGPGAAGSLRVDAARITVDGQGNARTTGILSNTYGSGAGGSVDVRTAGTLTLTHGGTVTASTNGDGQAGQIDVRAGSVVVDGRGLVTGIGSETEGAGHAGAVTVLADGAVVIRDGGRISSSSFRSGDAGSVRVRGASMVISDAQPGAGLTGVLSITRESGRAGTVEVGVSGLLSISDAVVSTSSLGTGRGGSVTVEAGNLTVTNLSGSTRGSITSNAEGGGDAGNVKVTVAQALSIAHGGSISSSTLAAGAAGRVEVVAGSVTMGDPGSVILSETYGSGAGGAVQVTVADHLAIRPGAVISSSTFGTGAGGQVVVRAGSANLDNRGGQGRTGIGSVAASGTGDAGTVDVGIVGTLSLSNGAEISANTSTPGAAGSVRVGADTVSLASGASINSGATAGSSGRTGDVVVVASRALELTDAQLSIRNDATVNVPGTLPATRLAVSAPRIDLARAEITASSTGNVAAGRIAVDCSGLLQVREGSAINTSAVSGQGGSIVVGGGGVLVLDHARVTTSVTGTRNGDGGPITIDSPLIVLKSGFVQANTAVAEARGGDVSINARSPGLLIASHQQLVSGGRPVAYGGTDDGPNVIQAARPDGVNGDLRIESPQVDLSGSLAALATPQVDFGTLGADICRVGDGSSLTPVGRGGLKPPFSAPVRPTP